MEIREDRQGDAVVITPVGRLDSNTSEDFQAWLAGRFAAGLSRLVVDMSATDYVSSAGIRIFLMTAKKLADTGGSMALSGMNPSVRQVFQLAGLLPIFTIEPDVARAVARVTAG